MKRIFLLSMTLILTTICVAQAQDSIRKMEPGRTFEKPKGFTPTTKDTNEDLLRFTKLLAEAKASQDLSAAEAKLTQAEQLCSQATLEECSSKIEKVRRELYLSAFQQKMRHLRSADWNYQKQLTELEVLESYLDKGGLEETYRKQWTQLADKIHDDEVRRLLDRHEDFEAYMESIDKASAINTEHLNGKLTALIKTAELDAVDSAIEDLLNDRSTRGDFRQQLRRVEKAYAFTERLSESEKRSREAKLRSYRQEVVQYEFASRKRALRHTTDWRETLAAYEDLYGFARKYQEDLDRYAIRNLNRERESFLVQEYEVRIQESRRRLQNGDLTGAQLALAGAVELSQTNLLPEGPAAYRHRELYQTLYEAQHQRLQQYKAAANWDAADQTILIIESLFHDAPFILARASIREERQLLELARWEYFLAEADQVLRSAGTREKYDYFNQLLDGYQGLRPLLNRDHELAVARAVQRFGQQPMDAARQAAERNAYVDAMQQLQPWNEFLYTSGHQKVLAEGLYRDFDQLFRYVLQGEQEQLIAQMQSGNYDFEQSIALRRRFELGGSTVATRNLMADYEAELRFMEVYERGKSALRRAQYQESMQYFEKAADRQSQFRFNGQYTISTGDKVTLIDNGKRLSLEGMLLEEIERNNVLAASAKKEAYRSIWRLRRAYPEVPMTQKAETALTDAELNWFGGACRTDYREYTMNMLDAEDAIDRSDYRNAVAALQKAKRLLGYIERCMLPVDDVDYQIGYYQLAVDFNERKSALENLHRSHQFTALEEAYQSLWQDYQRYDIQQKFGYQMVSFDTYVLRSDDASLLEYFILDHAEEDEYLDAIVEGIRQLSHRYSKDKMKSLGAEVAYRMYACMPGKKYQTSFAYLTPKGGYDKRSFKAFKKGYKQQWKKMR